MTCVVFSDRDYMFIPARLETAIDAQHANTMRRILPIIISLLCLGVFGAHSARPASADCGGRSSPAQAVRTAPIIFVGTVVATADYGASASVRVEDVWRGARVPRIVKVDGTGNQKYGTASRSFKRGKIYWFVPYTTRYRWLFYDNICSATRLYTKRLARYRPRRAHRPTVTSRASQ